MKKFLAILLCMTMMLAIGVTAAADFTPSVSSKSAPEVSKAVDSTGAKVSVKVTAVSDTDELDKATKEVLTNAYETILEAKDLTELVPEDELVEVLKDIAPEIAAEDLVVRDLMLIDVGDVTGEVTVTLEANVDPDTPVVILYSVDGVHWEVLSSEFVIVNKDGSLTITIDSSCAVAIAVPSED